MKEEKQEQELEQEQQQPEEIVFRPQTWESPSSYRPDGSPREWGDYGDDD